MIRRKAILMIHGFVGGNYDYGDLINELELVKNFDVFTYTLPGHEKLIVKNVKQKDWIKESERQIDILIQNKYKNIYVIGHSMGGVLATYLAYKYPKYVKKLVLVAPAFKYCCFDDDKLDIMKSIQKLPQILNSLPHDEVVERLIKTPIPTIIEFTNLVKENSNLFDKINCPTLIIHGKEDLLVPKDSTELVYNNINSKSVKLVNISKVNHNCFTGKRKEEVNNIIINYLKHTPKRKKEITDI